MPANQRAAISDYDVIQSAYQAAIDNGNLRQEFGDVHLIL